MATDGRKTRGIRVLPDRLQDEALRPFLEDVERLSRLFKQVADDPALFAVATPGTGGSPTPGPPGPPGAPAPGTTPDLTPPPTPTGLTATAGFANVFIQWDAAVYTQGHGNLQTNIYGAKYPGTGPLPTFSNAVLVGVAPQPDTIFVLPTELGTQWHIWIKFQSRDGVESVTPAGGANGAQATTGKIGNADLGPLIVEAGNLASGAVTATKLAAGAVEFTKFAAGLEPVGVVGSLPIVAGYTGPRTVVLTTDGKLYRLVAGAWTAAVPAADVTGQLTDAQIASIAAAKLTGQITSTQITDGAISTPKLAAGAVTAAQIAADTITAAQIAAGAITAAELAAGSVTTSKLNAGAVTANEIAANAITTAKIAAGAVNADQIAAGAIRTDKLLVTGRGTAINEDPNFQDTSAWALHSGVAGTFATGTGGSAVAATYYRASGGQVALYSPRRYSVDAAKTYRLGAHVYTDSLGGTLLLGIRLFDGGGNYIVGDSLATYYVVSTSSLTLGDWAPYSGLFGAGTAIPIPAGAKGVEIAFILNLGGSPGQVWGIQNFRLEERIGADLIVDGSIIATKLAANAIAVGSAAIQNGAIVNAMIANGTIDDAKIATLAAGKITAGSLGVGSFIQSNDYVSGVSGWRISGSGFAELGAASIRGQLTASQIDSRGLSIRDLSGNVILAAGSPLAASNIVPAANWLNANITLNSNGTISGAGGGAVTLGGLGAGAFATLNQINAANISTYIAAAAIGTAYIQDASITDAKIATLNASKIIAGTITTDKIQVGSVSVAENANGISDSLALPAANSTAIVGRQNCFSLTTTGAPITVTGIVRIDVTPTATTGTVLSVFLQLYVDGVNVNFFNQPLNILRASGGVNGRFTAVMPVFARFPAKAADGSTVYSNLTAGTHSFGYDVQMNHYNATSLLNFGGGTATVTGFLAVTENKV